MEITRVNLTLDLVSECAFAVLRFVYAARNTGLGDYKILHDFFPPFVQLERTAARFDHAYSGNFRRN